MVKFEGQENKTEELSDMVLDVCGEEVIFENVSETNKIEIGAFVKDIFKMKMKENTPFHMDDVPECISMSIDIAHQLHKAMPYAFSKHKTVAKSTTPQSIEDGGATELKNRGADPSDVQDVITNDGDSPLNIIC